MIPNPRRKRRIARVAMFSLTIPAMLMLSRRADAMGKIAFDASANINRTIPVGVIKRVSITTHGGNIVVTGVPDASNIQVTAVKTVWDKTPSRAHKALAQLDINAVTQGDQLSLSPKTPDNWKKTYQVAFFVNVPASYHVDANSSSGAIQIHNVREVNVSGGSGDVLLRAVNAITTTTTSGSVEIGKTSGPVDVTTADGSVRIHLAGVVKSVRVLTKKGDVTLQVPPTLGAELGVTTTKGYVNTEGLTLLDARNTRYGLQATVNNGGIPIEVTSTSGGVNVTTSEIGPGKIHTIESPAMPAPVAAPTPAPAATMPPPPAMKPPSVTPDTTSIAPDTTSTAPDTTSAEMKSMPMPSNVDTSHAGEVTPSDSTKSVESMPKK